MAKSKKKTAKNSPWQSFVKARMKKYLKEEGNFKAAMKRISKEYKEQ